MLLLVLTKKISLVYIAFRKLKSFVRSVHAVAADIDLDDGDGGKRAAVAATAAKKKKSLR